MLSLLGASLSFQAAGRPAVGSPMRMQQQQVSMVADRRQVSTSLAVLAAAAIVGGAAPDAAYAEKLPWWNDPSVKPIGTGPGTAPKLKTSKDTGGEGSIGYRADFGFTSSKSYCGKACVEKNAVAQMTKNAAK